MSSHHESSASVENHIMEVRENAFYPKPDIDVAPGDTVTFKSDRNLTLTIHGLFEKMATPIELNKGSSRLLTVAPHTELSTVYKLEEPMGEGNVGGPMTGTIKVGSSTHGR